MQNASLFPTLQVDPTAERQRYSGTRASGSPVPILGPVTQNSYILPFTVSYEVDLFGKVRRTIEAAQSSYQANAADLENVRLILAANSPPITSRCDNWTRKSVYSPAPCKRCKRAWIW